MSITLPGLTPQPLAGYLSAMGLFRIVAEQLDPDVTGVWLRDELVLDGPDADDLVGFLLDRFVPSPVFSPWNKEGDPSQNPTTADQLSRLIAGESPRFDPYRSTFSAWQAASQDPRWVDGDKTQRLLFWRSVAPDEALGWMDAAVALVSDKAEFPPLLGSGGNDGRFEFSRLLHGELIRVFLDSSGTPKAEGWLRALLFGGTGPPLVESTSGMYDADAAGTPNSSPQGSAKSASNPWTILLAFEGLIAFGASVASRLGAGRRQMVGAPFMVRASRLGDESAPNEDARGEFWAPLWDHAARWPEVRRVISEGRLAWHGRQAANTVDAARAVASLGVDRGIRSFVRHQVVQRNGKSYIATPVGRVMVRSVRGAPELAAIDPWVASTRAAGGDSVAAAHRSLDRAQTAVVSDGGTAGSLQEVLVAVVALEHALGRSVAGREKAAPFPNRRGGRPTLDATIWMPLLDDGTPELLAAASLASLSSQDLGVPYRWMSLALRGLAGEPAGPEWPISEDRRDANAAATSRAPDEAPLEVLHRRLRSSDQVAPDDADPAHRAAYSGGLRTPLRVVLGILDGRVELSRVLRLANAMSLLDGWDPSSIGNLPNAHDDRSALAGEVKGPPVVVDPWFAASRLCLLDRGFRLGRSEGDATVVHPLPRRSWGRLVAAGRLTDVAGEALGILRRHAVTSLRRATAPADLDPVAAAVALLLPLPPSDVDRLVDAVGDPQRSPHPIDSDHDQEEHR